MFRGSTKHKKTLSSGSATTARDAATAKSNRGLKGTRVAAVSNTGGRTANTGGGGIFVTTAARAAPDFSQIWVCKFSLVLMGLWSEDMDHFYKNLDDFTGHVETKITTNPTDALMYLKKFYFGFMTSLCVYNVDDRSAAYMALKNEPYRLCLPETGKKKVDEYCINQYQTFVEMFDWWHHNDQDDDDDQAAAHRKFNNRMSKPFPNHKNGVTPNDVKNELIMLMKEQLDEKKHTRYTFRPLPMYSASLLLLFVLCRLDVITDDIWIKPDKDGINHAIGTFLRESRTSLPGARNVKGASHFIEIWYFIFDMQAIITSDILVDNIRSLRDENYGNRLAFLHGWVKNIVPLNTTDRVDKNKPEGDYYYTGEAAAPITLALSKLVGPVGDRPNEPRPFYEEHLKEAITRAELTARSGQPIVVDGLSDLLAEDDVVSYVTSELAKPEFLTWLDEVYNYLIDLKPSSDETIQEYFQHQPYDLAILDEHPISEAYNSMMTTEIPLMKSYLQWYIVRAFYNFSELIPYYAYFVAAIEWKKDQNDQEGNAIFGKDWNEVKKALDNYDDNKGAHIEHLKTYVDWISRN